MSDLGCRLYKEQVKDDTPDWKECKLLGSKIDAKEDIKRRKILILASMKSMKVIYKSKQISLQMKIRNFEAFSRSVFLYNYELWTLTSKREEQINTFHRRLFRKVIEVYWLNTISNENNTKKSISVPWVPFPRHGT